jgi:hypothetical protein
MWSNVNNEPQHGVAHLGFIALFVGLEPLAIIVKPQVKQKLKQGHLEVGMFSHP